MRANGLGAGQWHAILYDATQDILLLLELYITPEPGTSLRHSIVVRQCPTESYHDECDNCTP